MRFTLLLFLVLLCILPTDSIFGRRGRSSSFGSSNRRNFFSRSRGSSYGWNIPRNAVKKPGLSKKAKYALFGAGGLAAGVYLGSKLRGYDPMSIRNNNNFNMCPGRHVNADMSGQYNNFVCPEQPGDFYNNQCCYSNGVGYCCPSSFGNSFNQRAGGIGGSIGGILFLVIIGACIYCLCCKKKSQPEQPTEMYAPDEKEVRLLKDQPNYPNNPPDYGNTTYPSQPSYPVQPPPAYPDQNPTGVYPPAPGYPNNNPAYPSNAPGYPSGNPAPYPTGQPGYPPSNNQAPYPGWNQ